MRMRRQARSRPSVVALLASLVLSAGVVSCGGGGDPTAPPGVAASLTVTPDSVTLSVGDHATLTADVRDSSGLQISNAHVVWTSLDDTIVTVDQAGVVTGVAPGDAKVMAADGAAADTVDVFVLPNGSCEGVRRVASWHVSMSWSYAQDIPNVDNFHVTVKHTADFEGTLLPVAGQIPTDEWIGEVTGTGSINDSSATQGVPPFTTTGSGPLVGSNPFDLTVDTQTCTYTFVVAPYIHTHVNGTGENDEPVGTLVGKDVLGSWQFQDLKDHGRTFPGRLLGGGIATFEDAYYPGGLGPNLWPVGGAEDSQPRGSAIVSYTIHADSTRIVH